MKALNYQVGFMWRVGANDASTLRVHKTMEVSRRTAGPPCHPSKILDAARAPLALAMMSQTQQHGRTATDGLQHGLKHDYAKKQVFCHNAVYLKPA